MKRYKALDIFRGMTICLMIIVNTPGTWSSVFAPLLHADWHGFTPTDLVFPSFLFAVGTSFAFVMQRYGKDSKSIPWKKLIWRTLLIFFLGYTMYWLPFMKWNEAGELTAFPISETRIWGVLQRIAVCYFLAAVMIFYLSKRNLVYASIGLLMGYWAALWGFGDYTLENNAVRTLDLFLFGESHLYGGDGIPFDPEGLLSTFPAIVNVIGGYMVGVFIIENKKSGFEKVAYLLMIGAALATVAYFWHHLFPINKKLWTSSFVALTIGLDFMVLGVLIFLIDVKDQPFDFKFFEVFGKNPLFIYLLSEYVAIMMWFVRIGDQPLYTWIYENAFAWIGPYYGSFVFALLFMLLCWAAGWWLDKKKIYLRV